MLRNLGALALWLAPGIACAAATPFLGVERYGLDEGLSQLSVNAIVADDRGFLWLGTQEGLNRFDGHRFEVLRTGTDGGLVSSSIDALAVDGRSRLWIGSNDAGLEVLELRGGPRRRLDTGDGLSHPTVRHILVDAGGGAWLGTPAGIDRVDAAVERVQQLAASAPVVAMLQSPQSGPLALDRDCRLWRLRPQAVDARSPLPAPAQCVAMAAAAEGVWLATAADGVYLLSPDGEVLRRLELARAGPASVTVTAMVRRRDGSLLLGLSDGSLLQAPVDGSAALQPVATDRAIASAVKVLAEQDSGVLWIGTHTQGLFRVRVLSAAVRRDLGASAASAGWPGRAVFAILRDRGRTLVGTDAGLAIQREPEGAWRTFPALAGTPVRAIVAADEGGWWVGTHRGLWWLHEDGRARQFEGLPDPRVTALLAEDGVLWIATRGGLARLRDGVVGSNGLPAELRTRFLTALMRDREGRLWIGSNEQGLYRLAADGALEQLDSAGGQLRSDSIWALHEDGDAYWLGSFSGGLHRIDRASGALRVTTEDDGLSNNVVYRIEPDGSGRLWLSTNNGLSVVDRDGEVVRTLLAGDGLRNREFNSGASFRDDDGLIRFGGTEGVDVIDPSRLDPQVASASPVIGSLRVLGRRGEATVQPDDRSIDPVYAGRVALDYRDVVLALEMVAIDFTAPRAARLRYRIGGIHDDWVQPPGPRAELMLSHLPPGDYPLEVEAAGRDGRFGASRRLLLSMPPPPWLSPAAYAGYLLLLVALAAWVLLRIRARRREAQARIELLNRTVAERTAELERANRLLQESNRQLEVATRTDPLTQVSNRRDLQQWLDRECPRVLGEAAGATVPQLYFCMIDIDDFKRVNDHYGHQIGDEVLVELAARLRALCRQHDIIVRWGGEEFALVLREADADDAAALATRVRDALACEPLRLPGGLRLDLTCSIGFAPWPLSPSWPGLCDWDQSVGLADRALYAAKAAGKNTWVGLVPGAAADRACLLSLLAGAVPASLPAGCVEVLHPPGVTPRFLRS